MLWPAELVDITEEKVGPPDLVLLKRFHPVQLPLVEILEPLSEEISFRLKNLKMLITLKIGAML